MSNSHHGDRLASAIARDTGITRANLLHAFAVVERERFLGPPPWLIAKPAYDGSDGAEYEQTTELASLYSNVSVALDPDRQLYNGQPGTVAVWLDALNPRAGERVFHVGCGSGYYTAILATLVGPAGSVIAVDVDELLVNFARKALADCRNVSAVVADAGTFDPGVFDVALVNAGFSVIPDSWLSGLSPSHGRLVIPLTVPLPSRRRRSNLSKGIVFLIERAEQAYFARMLGGAIIFTAAGNPPDAAQKQLIESLRRGNPHEVRSLRRDAHAVDTSCWLHAERYCFSRVAPPDPI
jgi:protein-L-isoaspartate(D-aspartate) O-methyltransferase